MRPTCATQPQVPPDHILLPLRSQRMSGEGDIQAQIDAPRTAHIARHDNLRKELIDIALTMFSGSQAKLAKALNLPPKYLAEYNTGKWNGKQLDRLQLGSLHDRIRQKVTACITFPDNDACHE